eukprot:scaffold65064_cov68-Phaeocystis_antarctica.AAC.2
MHSPAQVVGGVVLAVTLTAQYPHDAGAATFEVTSLVGSKLFPHQQAHEAGRWAPTAEQAVAVAAVAVAAAAEMPRGEPALWEVIEAVRSWLEEHTLTARPSVVAGSVQEVQEAMGGAEISEDDLELDEEDMDAEMVDAVREVLTKGQKALERKLDMAEAMKANSKAQRTALKEVWLELTPAQRRQMVASDDEDDDSDDSDDSEDEAAAAPPKKGGSGKKAAAQQKQGACPPPAQRTCARGHALTAGNAKPADYKKMSGGEGNCDLCGKDFFYQQGGYHCDSCHNWDCCVACGSTAAKAAAGQGKKNQKGRKR